MRTLWDMLTQKPPRRRRRVPPASRPAAQTTTRQEAKRASPMRDRYEEITRRKLAEYGVRVRKWRTSMSGVAWQVTYEDGRVTRLIEAPRPRGPMSCAVFLHEIGHHAIGFKTYKPRCLEEYHAWKYALETMEAEGLNVTEAVRRRMAESLHYAIVKARRRGLKRLPAELVPYLEPPRRR